MSNRPQVGIVMGSDSDWPVMEGALEVLSDFGVECEVRVISAHRTPEVARKYAEGAEDRGLEVVIAGAGKAAHLAGVIAASTVLPVIGVPVKTSSLGGADSLYSMVQMPSGVPVATVALDGAKNAGILAIQILSLKNEDLHRKLVEYREQMTEQVKESDRMLRDKIQD